MLASLPRGSQRPKNPEVPGLNELYGKLPIRSVGLDARGNWRGGEALERRKEFQGRAILSDKVLEQKKLHVSSKIIKEAKKASYRLSWSLNGLRTLR